MSINFDLEALLQDLSPIEQNYFDFLDIDDSFLGWLLTLNDVEFQQVRQGMGMDENFQPDGSKPLLLTQIEMYKRKESQATFKELLEDLVRKQKMISLISLVREGLLEYETDKDDLDWEFKLTPKGISLTDKLFGEENIGIRETPNQT